MDYAVIDVETSGGKYNEESIIEIAVYRFDGEKIIDTFISLVNPEKKIHFFVQKLTGITHKMVKTAPKFHELAKRLVEITDDAVVVAHNVDFDYRVICTEYLRLGFDFQRPTLDTLTLSKILLPDQPSYSLGKLCISLGIPLSDRHRAYGDARATVKLFQFLMAKDIQKNIIRTSVRSQEYSSFNTKIIRLMEDLPTETGVFYFHDKKGKIIYMNKAVCIVDKVRQVLTSNDIVKKKLQKKTDYISYELTGNEIIAMVKVKNELKINHPEFRPELEISDLDYGIFRERAKHKEVVLVVEKIDQGNKNEVVLSFKSLDKAHKCIKVLSKKVEDLKSKSIKNIISELYLRKGNALLIDQGRSRGEKSFLYLEKGVLKGYGFYSLYSQIKDKERVIKIMTQASGTMDIYLKIRNKMAASKKFEKVIYL